MILSLCFPVIGFFNGVFNSLLFPTTTSLFRSDLAREAWAFCQVPPGIAIIIGPGIAGIVLNILTNRCRWYVC